MQKLFLIITAISLSATAAGASAAHTSTHSVTKPHGEAVSSSVVKQKGDSTTVSRTTNIDINSKDGSAPAATVGRDIEREYDSTNKSVTSSGTTSVNSKTGISKSRSFDREHDSQKAQQKKEMKEQYSKDQEKK